MEKTKKCTKCNEIKKVSEFYKDKTHKDGLSTWCKKCQKEYQRVYEKKPENIVKLKKYYKEYRIKNRDKQNNYCKEYYKNPKNKEKIKLKKQTFENRFKTVCRGAKARNIKFNLSLEEYKLFWNKPCYYCGGKTVNGLDRVDNNYNIGYTKENCVPCCGDCNIMKRSLSEKEFIKKIEQIYKNYNKKK